MHHVNSAETGGDLLRAAAAAHVTSTPDLDLQTVATMDTSEPVMAAAAYPLLAELLNVPLMVIRHQRGLMVACSYGGCILGKPVNSVAIVALNESAKQYEAVAFGQRSVCMAQTRTSPHARCHTYFLLPPGSITGM
jgi:hypothetical protein